MRRLVAFNNVTLDGYFTGENGDISWFKNIDSDPEFKAFIAENASGNGMLLFGRVTYELMAGYWPTPHAMQQDPVVAKGMNSLPKIVFSRTLSSASWSNTKLVKGDLLAEVRRLKDESDRDMAILGSGSIVSQLTKERMIDEYQFVVNPVIIGKGRPLFDGVKTPLPLKLTRTRAFRNGNVLLCYEPAV
jgi:dihydrofolate reductase